LAFTDLKKAVLARRTVLKTAALATTALAAPFVRGANAVGKLSFGVWAIGYISAANRLRKNSTILGNLIELLPGMPVLLVS